MRFLIPLLAGAIGFVMAAAIVLVVVVLQPDPPPAAPILTAPTAPPTPPTATQEPTPTEPPRPSPTPPPIARCLTADGRSLDLESQFVSNTMRQLADRDTPTLVSITNVGAINLRHEYGTSYKHTASYTIVARGAYPGAAPVTTTVVVSGTINAANCATALR